MAWSVQLINDRNSINKLIFNKINHKLKILLAQNSTQRACIGPPCGLEEVVAQLIRNGCLLLNTRENVGESGREVTSELVN